MNNALTQEWFFEKKNCVNYQKIVQTFPKNGILNIM